MPKLFDTNKKDKARNRANRKHKREKLKELTATLVVEGDPTLLAGNVINIANVATVYEGVWYITKATHQIGKSGFTTTLELNRNASNAPASAQSVAVQSLGNTALNTITETPKNARINKEDGGKITRYDANGKKL
jgi:hypothetical protein